MPEWSTAALSAKKGRPRNAGMDKQTMSLAAERGSGRSRYASPEVSNIADSMASRAGFPAQTTNWNAG